MAFWLASAPLVLASRSAARRALLEAAGIPVELRPADLDERALEANAISQEPTVVATFLAREKAPLVVVTAAGRKALRNRS
jgi:septum formation protein